MADSSDFEITLRNELRRGLKPPPRVVSRETAVRSWWLPPEQMAGSHWDYGRGSLLLGRRAVDNDKPRLIGWHDDRHVCTVAGSRAGKGVSFIIPNLLTYPGSALVIDPKGDNAYYTAAARAKMGQEVLILDPFGVSGQKQKGSLNPLSELQASDKFVVDDAAKIAEAMIIPAEREPHWGESAQSLVRSLILMALNELEPRKRNLNTVRDLLRLEFQELKRKMSYEAANDTVIVGTGAHLDGMGENERGSVLSTARTQTQWMDSEPMREVLARSGTVQLSSLKQKPCTIYLCLPANYMGTHNRWLRLIVSLLLSVMERRKEKPEHQVLFLLDEFPVLGHMRSIEDAAGQMAGFGVKLWTIIQDLSQLQKHYDKSWSTFLGNCGVLIAFGNTDMVTLTELSKHLGRTFVEEERSAGATAFDLQRGSMSVRLERGEAPLLAEHEIRLAFGRSKKRALILTAEYEPAIVERLVYHEDPEFAGMYADYRG